MNGQAPAQPAIAVEEVYTYSVDVGVQTDIQWNQSESTTNVRVTVPYNDRVTYNSRPLSQIPSPAARLHLGDVVFTSSGGHEITRVAVHLPAGPQLVDHVLSGQQMVQKWSYEALKPEQHLISVEGKVFDGADDSDLAAIRTLFGDESSMTAFVNDLRLRLKLWMPDVLETNRQTQYHQLRAILREQEHSEQILLQASDLNNSQRLAQSMVALANSPRGGRIILGLTLDNADTPIAGNSNEERQNTIVEALLQALLRCSPAIPIAGLDYFRGGNNDIIAARLTIPAGLSGSYRCDGTVYLRKGSVTVGVVARRKAPPKRPTIDNISAHKLQDVLRTGSTDDVIVLDAKRDISNLDLAKWMCGLVNGSQSGGLLVIHNLPLELQSAWMSLPLRNGMMPSLEEQLNRSLEHCFPKPKVSSFWVTRFQKERVAVLRVQPGAIPVALYRSSERAPFEAYQWEYRTLNGPIKLSDLFGLYMQRLGSSAEAQSDDNAQVVYADLSWPMQPPLQLHANGQSILANEGRYTVQRQALTWRKQRFERTNDGATCELDASLRSGLVNIDQNGVTQHLQSPILTGTIIIRFDNVLFSGIDIQHHETPQTATWFQHVPIKRSTKLVLKLKVRMDELFTHRRKLSLSHFYIPHTLLDSERVRDIAEVLTDLGFRITDQDIGENFSDLVLSGVRSKGYQDILMYAYIQCKRDKLTRELRYEQRHDVQETATAQLDCRIVLRGESEQAVADIGKLHLAIHALLDQRLHYLNAQ